MSEERKIVGWRSVAFWPDAIKLGTVGNTSTDKHASKEAAEGVCRMLQRDGFGGERKHFPIKVRVEPIYKGDHHS